MVRNSGVSCQGKVCGGGCRGWVEDWGGGCGWSLGVVDGFIIIIIIISIGQTACTPVKPVFLI